MNLGLDNVEPNQSRRVSNSTRYHTTSTSLSLPTASQVTVLHDPQTIIPTPSSQMTAIPYAPTPPEAPTYYSVPSDEEIYGPDRQAAFPVIYPEHAADAPVRHAPSVRFNPAVQFAMSSPTDPLVNRDFKDELTRAACVVTPGVSDVPYIQYALEALTRLPEEARVRSGNSGSSSEDDAYRPQYRDTPDYGVNITQPQPVHRSPPSIHDDNEDGDEESIPEAWPVPPSKANLQRPEPTIFYPRDVDGKSTPGFTPPPEPRQRPRDHAGERLNREWERAKKLGDKPQAVEINQSPPRTVDIWREQTDAFPSNNLEASRYAPSSLTHKPWILRTPALLGVAALCILMITALIFSAVYSIGREGLTTYDHTIYGGQYFVFRVLPQLIGAFVLIYTQCVIAAIFRIYPLSAMASNDRNERRNAVFLPLYPKSFLWPQLVGPWNIWVPGLIIWLLNFTIPLLSSLYTVVFVNGVWTWSTVQGVAWTLVAVYVSLLFSTVVLFVFWRHRRTGMMAGWDIRSIADIIFLVSQSNSLPRYRGLETAASRGHMRDVLDGTAERLGYWTTPEVPENAIFWSIGVTNTEDGSEEEIDSQGNRIVHVREKRSSNIYDIEKQAEPWVVRTRYLPWCFRDSQIIFFVIAGTILLIALIAVSFSHSTELRNGFLPGLNAAPQAGAFSPADFLYSFVPSLIGLALFLAFQSLELTERVLAPWGELARESGSRADKSLFLDYAACLPWQSTYKALKYAHWRVAAITFLSPVLVLLPVLSGGIFMSLATHSGQVRVFPNLAIFGVILALLVLYLAALISLIPGRKRLRLPHAVTCLAEIMSFCCNEQLRTDDAFNRMRIGTRDQFRAALDCGKDWHRQSRWTFGQGRNNEERLGIKRFSKFTVNNKKLKMYDRFARGERAVAGQLYLGSGSLFGD
ncbi:hypothetical protein F5Y16DRAFT_380555 [Xylariaceae sp. FL0255]|nr:hypothetical protein F5Y16DRAFT_380555 [Xylariaceae sp. FL0255]